MTLLSALRICILNVALIEGQRSCGRRTVLSASRRGEACPFEMAIPEKGQGAAYQTRHAALLCLSERRGCGRMPRRARPQKQKPQRGFRCGFYGPDTRQLLLPLLPFGPDGVGSAAAVRLGKCFTWKGGGCQCPTACAICPVPAASRPGMAAALLMSRSSMLSLRPPFS
ncbi:MAG: hypothetical protein DESF_01233 [Desulfovibrio sp.]